MRCPSTRRYFLRQAARAGAGTFLMIRPSRGGQAPSAKLNLAVIGAGGRGWANLNAMAGENIVALCDVDRARLDRAASKFPGARTYVDFRELFDQENDLDGAVVSTPDHCHAPASVMAMKLGLHVYCEKPLTHSVHEARVMTETATDRR